jgi:hypothetical protein
MHGWWISMGVLLAAFAALAPIYRRRRHRRRRLDQVRARVGASLSELKAGRGPAPISGGGFPPTSPSAPPPPRAAARRLTVMSDDLASGITVGPRWRMR